MLGEGLWTVLEVLLLQFGISWESVFDIFARNAGNIFESLLKSQLKNLLNSFLKEDQLYEILLRTPSPQMRGSGVLFGTPKQPIWSHLKSLYWNLFLPVGYLALFLSVMISNFGKSWGFGIGKEKQRKLGLLVGLFLIPGGWYLAIAYLKIMNLFALGIAPDLVVLQKATVDAFSEVLVQDASYAALVGTTGIIAYLVAMLVNLIRLFAIWILVPTLPLILGFDLGEFPILGNFSRRAYTMFAVLGAVPIPVAIGTRIIYSFHELINNGGSLFYGDIAATVFVILIPTLAALVPVYVLAQAADYATIRGATATLSIIGKPASLAASAATSGGSSAASNATKAIGSRMTSRDNDDEDGSGGDGGGGGGGPGSSSGSGRNPGGTRDGGAARAGSTQNGWGGLPKRQPSGAQPVTHDSRQPSVGSHANGAGSTPTGQSGDGARADDIGRGSSQTSADYVSDGEVVAPDADFATYADREFARSQVLSKGRASPYHPDHPISREHATQAGDRQTDEPIELGSVSANEADSDPEIVDETSDRAAARTRHQREPTNWERDRRKRMNRAQKRNRERYSGY